MTELAVDLGRRWVHGLIDLDRWTRTNDWIDPPQERALGWDPVANDSQVDDDELRRELLSAFRRMLQASTPGSFPSIDVQGFADVLRVDVERVRKWLREFDARDYLELYGPGLNAAVERGNAQITAAGLEALDELEARLVERGSGLLVLEEAVVGYLDDQTFKEHYETALLKWQQASELLYGDDADNKAGQIGHVCREAVQEFAASLVDRYAPPDPPANKEHTVARVRAVLDHCAPRLGESKKDFLDAILGYWGALTDLVQRQEHSATKEGEALTADDSRRVVFHTAIVMYEIAGTLPEP